MAPIISSVPPLQALLWRRPESQLDLSDHASLDLYGASLLGVQVKKELDYLRSGCLVIIIYIVITNGVIMDWFSIEKGTKYLN